MDGNPIAMLSDGLESIFIGQIVTQVNRQRPPFFSDFCRIFSYSNLMALPLSQSTAGL